MERRLGRGLGALLPDSTQGQSTLEVELDGIRPNPHQPRETFAPSGLEELRQSIVNHGVLQPVVVRKVDGGYELVSGERRWRAARLAGLRSIPAIVRAHVTEDAMLELALVENVQREDLDPIERARGFRQLMDRLQLTQERVAERVGLKRSTVANHVRLLELPEAIQQAVSEGALTMGHARALLALQDRTRLPDLAQDIVRGQLSVRQAEEMVRQETGSRKASPSAEEKGKAPGQAESTEPGPPPPWTKEIERRLQENLGTKATIRNGADYRGQIVIEYFGRDDLERLLQLLAPAPDLET